MPPSFDLITSLPAYPWFSARSRPWPPIRSVASKGGAAGKGGRFK